MDDRTFDRILRETLDSLPPDLRRALDTVQIVVQDRPSPEQLESVGLEPDEVLYGLFEGVALPEKSFPDTQYLPDRVAIFKGPLEEDFPSSRDLGIEVRKTLIHELGHYFGFTEEDLERRGYR